MKILLVNYRYYISGGPERYLFNLKAGLEAEGHEVVPFSINYTQNQPTEYDRYFVPPLAGEQEVYFESHKWTLKSLYKTIERSVYSPEVSHAIYQQANEQKPDAAYVLHYLKKLSPAVLTGLKKAGVPIVVRLSDYLMVCANALLLRDQKPCTECLSGSRWNGVRHRCVKDSLFASLVHYSATSWHQFKGYYDLIDQFVVPSTFMAECMMKGGWPKEKLVHIPTFAGSFFFEQTPLEERNNELVFSGNIEPHKGMDCLVEAMGIAKASLKESLPTLRLCGRTPEIYLNTLKQRIAELNLQDVIVFEGFVDDETLRGYYRRSLASIMPSICYENMPNVIVESYACGTPVLASNHGSMAPLVEHEKCGLLFEPGKADDLAKQIVRTVQDTTWRTAASHAARACADSAYTRTGHITKLLEVLAGVTS